MKDRAYGCMAGAAIGDAMGMPASFLTRKMIKAAYGYIHDFLEPEQSVQIYHKDLHAGEVTDDTQESLIVADVLIKHRRFDEKAFCAAMKDWALRCKMLESTVIGPSTRKFLTAVIRGENPAEGAKTGDTNGSAMRAAPIGIFYRNDFKACMEAAAASSMPSHGSAPACAAACAVAAACAAGVRGGFTPAEIMDIAAEAAKYGEEKGFDIPSPSVYRRLRLAKQLVDAKPKCSIDAILDELTGVFGAGMKAYESAVLALGIFYAVGGNAREGILAAVNAGDDADTNASICGAICGAYEGAAALPADWISRVERTSGVDFKALAGALCE